MPFGNNCICNRQNCTRFAHAITLPIAHVASSPGSPPIRVGGEPGDEAIAHAIIPKSHSNLCDYPYIYHTVKMCLPVLHQDEHCGSN